MTVDACWNRIGVQGDGSCPELEPHVHCRNCPVHADAALRLMDRDLRPGDLAEWTRHYAQPKTADRRREDSVVIFRVDAERLALPVRVVMEVADRRPIHSLPHRGAGLVLGVVNVRGVLLVCLSLRRALGIDRSGARTGSAETGGHWRLLVIGGETIRAACPVDEVLGVHDVFDGMLGEVPATVAKASTTHSKAVVPWQGHSVGLLDERTLFRTLQRSLA